jgi:hypothetical protein
VIVLRALVEAQAPYRSFGATVYARTTDTASPVMLFWARDASPGSQRTMRLIDTTVPLAARLITLARFPVFRTVARHLLAVADVARDGR